MSKVANANVTRYLANLRAEIDGAALYRGLAAATKDAARHDIFIELAMSEDRHAARWRKRLFEAGNVAPAIAPSLRVRALCWLARAIGPTAILPIAGIDESHGAESYSRQADAKDFALEEQAHARVFAAMASPSARLDIAKHERWHRGAGGGSLRAAVFGVNDGLCSNLSLVMGVAAATAGGSFVLLAGIAGLLSGAFSMAAGEYVSMKAQRELFERQLAVEKEELETSPEEERHELALIYRAKGLPKTDAERMAELLLADEKAGLDTLAREELGLDPEELGSPWGAAASSFVAFGFGAIVPVVPFIFSSGQGAIALSGSFGTLALLLIGAALSLFTGRSPVFSAARMLLIGWSAAGLTFLIGRILGVSLG